MANAIKKILLVIVALIVLLVVAVVGATMVLDPNDYKPQIEAAVEENTRLDLRLDGAIDWSLIPLGLELNQVEAQLENERLVKLDTLIAQVDFWSLLAFSPAVDTFVLQGLEANLIRNEQGQGNWERIMPEKTAADAAPSEPETAAPAEEPAAGESKPLKFEVEEVRIGDAVVHFTDKATGQSVTLDDFNLNARDITLGAVFPLDLSFRLALGQPQVNINGELSAELSASEDLKAFSVKGLDSRFDIQGEPIGGEQVTARLAGNLSANLDAETASVEGLTVSLGAAEMNSDLKVDGFGKTMALSGNFALQPFSLRELLSQLGQPAIETRDPEVLNKVGLSTQIGGPEGRIQLSDFTLTLDETELTGTAEYGLANGFVGANLSGNGINVDRYLPPKKDQPQPQSEGETTAEATPAKEGDLLPLETLRQLALDIQFKLGELVVSNLTMNDMAIKITGKDGLLKLEQFQGKLYEGTVKANATLDARTDNPSWQMREEISNVQTLPLLTDLAEVKMLSGGVNLTADVKTTGNRISALRENAKGQIQFNIADGAFEQMNLTRYACQGIAMANKDTLSKSDWATSTPFNDMSGKMVINGNTLNNTSLVAALSGLKLEGNGTVDLKELMMDYKVGLRVVGEIDKDPACRVNEPVQNIVIPVECKGDLAGNPASLCSFDGSRFRDVLVDMGKAKAKQKAQEKVEEKLGNKLEEKLGEEAGKNVKDKIKGFFQ